MPDSPGIELAVLRIVLALAVFVIGLPLVLFGRRLFWLAGGLAMALIGLVIGALIVELVYGGDVSINFNDVGGITTSLSPEADRNSPMVAAMLIITTVVGGIVGALILIRFARVASALVGLAYGPYLLLLILDMYQVSLHDVLKVLLALAAGIAGAIIAWRNPDTSLIVFSTLIGSNVMIGCLIQSLGLDEEKALATSQSAIFWIGLMLVGIIYQTSTMNKRRIKGPVEQT